MRTVASFTYWAPAIALTLASIAFAVLATELAPRAPTQNAATHDRSPHRRLTTTSRDSRVAELARATAAAPVAPEPLPSSRGAALEGAGVSPNIASFFPPPPMTLPPPLNEDAPARAPPNPEVP